MNSVTDEIYDVLIFNVGSIIGLWIMDLGVSFYFFFCSKLFQNFIFRKFNKVYFADDKFSVIMGK